MRSMSLRLMSVSILIWFAAGFLGGCADEAEYQRQRDAAVQQRDVANQTAIDASAALEKAKAAIAELEATKLALQKDSATRAAGFDDQVARLQAQISALEVGSTERTKAETLAVELQRLISSQREKSDAATAAIAEQISKAKAAADTASAIVSESKGKASAIDDQIKLADKQISASTSESTSAISSLISTFWPPAAALSPIIVGLGYKLARTNQAIATLKASNAKTTSAATRIVQSIEALAEISPAVKEAIERHAPVLNTIQTADGKAFVDAVQGRSPSSTIA